MQSGGMEECGHGEEMATFVFIWIPVSSGWTRRQNGHRQHTLMQTHTLAIFLSRTHTHTGKMTTRMSINTG